MIGIGVTTYKRKENLQECLSKINQHTKCSHQLYVATDSDSDRQGVAKRKNECLRNLKHCEHLFLFDDDCFPINDDYIDFFVDANKQTKEHHFSFCIDKIHNLKSSFFCGDYCIEVYEKVGGVFLYLTQSVLQKVGAFGEHYNLYGYEHIGYSMRIFDANLVSDFFTSLAETEKYIYSHDYFTPNFVSTMSAYDKDVISNGNKENFSIDVLQTYKPL